VAEQTSKSSPKRKDFKIFCRLPIEALWCKNHENPRDRNSHTRAPLRAGNKGHVIVSRPIERLDLQAEVARRREDELTRLRRQLEESQLRHDAQVTGHIFKKTSDTTPELPSTPKKANTAKVRQKQKHIQGVRKVPKNRQRQVLQIHIHFKKNPPIIKLLVTTLTAH
jgi:hypothetical protein